LADRLATGDAFGTRCPASSATAKNGQCVEAVQHADDGR